MKKIGILVLGIIASTSICVAQGSAGMSPQSPENQLGLGFTAGQPLGAHIAYAITAAIHVGTGVGIQLESNNNVVYFAPYFKLLLKGTKEFKPYLMVNVPIMNGGGTQTTESSTSVSLNIGGGGEYFITPNFGLFGGLSVLSLGLSPTPSRTLIGLLSPYVGIEWFFE
ncbi:MAG: hypothetical protein HQ472_04130 [Ignavibacteria bacterium]|nr:hypothetical protein [Ignavibacteria bacterium]